MSMDKYARSPDAYVLSSLNSRLFERMRAINRIWIEQLREIHRSESEFGALLLAANSPAEATSICHEWMAKRLETVASEHQTFTTAWLALVSDTTSAPELVNGVGVHNHATRARQRSAMT